MSSPNPPGGEDDPFTKRPPSAPAPGQPYGETGPPHSGQPQYGEPYYGQPQYGQPGPTQSGQAQYGAPGSPQQWGAPPQYQPVPQGYYPVFNSQGQQVLAPLASPGKRFGTWLLEAVLAIVTLGIGYLIWTLVVWGRGQTPGKVITNLKYVDVSTGRVADWGKSAMRDFVIRGLLVGLISAVTLYIGFLVMAFMIFNEQRNYQAGWDRIANTVVIDVANVQL